MHGKKQDKTLAISSAGRSDHKRFEANVSYLGLMQAQAERCYMVEKQLVKAKAIDSVFAEERRRAVLV